MQKQRNKESEGDVIEQIDSKIKVSSKTDRSIGVKNKCRETNRRKMQYKWRTPTLFEQYKNADTEPNYPNYSEEYYRWCPTRNGVDLFKICEVKVICKCVARALEGIGQAAGDTG